VSGTAGRVGCRWVIQIQDFRYAYDFADFTTTYHYLADHAEAFRNMDFLDLDPVTSIRRQ
jgi:hypothetical protein